MGLLWSRMYIVWSVGCREYAGSEAESHDWDARPPEGQGEGWGLKLSLLTARLHYIPHHLFVCCGMYLSCSAQWPDELSLQASRECIVEMPCSQVTKICHTVFTCNSCLKRISSSLVGLCRKFRSSNRWPVRHSSLLWKLQKTSWEAVLL